MQTAFPVVRSYSRWGSVVSSVTKSQHFSVYLSYCWLDVSSFYVVFLLQPKGNTVYYLGGYYVRQFWPFSHSQPQENTLQSISCEYWKTNLPLIVRLFVFTSDHQTFGSIQGQNCLGWINHGIVVGLCSELLKRFFLLQWYIDNRLTGYQNNKSVIHYPAYSIIGQNAPITGRCPYNRPKMPL